MILITVEPIFSSGFRTYHFTPNFDGLHAIVVQAAVQAMKFPQNVQKFNMKMI